MSRANHPNIGLGREGQGKRRQRGKKIRQDEASGEAAASVPLRIRQERSAVSGKAENADVCSRKVEKSPEGAGGARGRHLQSSG